ncbi:MAG: response regulator [Anaeromyxobacteraceae bacterium]
MKVIVCTDSDLVRDLAALALTASGVEVDAGREPAALAASAPVASALLVDANLAQKASRLLRDRGFTGRALLLGTSDDEDLRAQAKALELDGVLSLSPEEDIGERLVAAIGQRRRVLIVDDSEVVARLLSDELTAKGFDVQWAPDAEKAATIILRRQTRPELILLDVNMPKVDGAQFCRFVKRNEMFRSIKVIFCSGEDRAKVERLVQECGADGFIPKDELLGKWIVEHS